MIRGASRPSARLQKLLVDRPVERLLPALRVAGLGYRAGRLAMQESGDATRRSPPRRARSTGCRPSSCSMSRATGRSTARACAAAAGHSSSRTATTRIWTTPPWSPGPCTRRAIRRDYAESVAPRARLAGGHAERATAGSPRSTPTTPRYYLNKIPFADHGALLDPPDQRCDGARGRRCWRASAARRTGRRWSARSPICAPSRSRTAPGSAAGAPITSTAPGRC